MKFEELDNSTQIILKIIFAGLALVFLWAIKDIILILILALILASAMDPMVNYLKEHKIPRSVSVITVYILVLAVFGLVIYSIVPIVIDQFKILMANLPNYSSQFQERFGSYFGSFSLSDFLGQTFSGITGTHSVVATSFGIFDSFISFISLLVISFYLVAEEQGMKTFIKTLVPPQHHEFTLSIIVKIQKKMGLWVLGQVIVSLLMFATTWIGLLILGVPYALTLAVVAGVAEVVPYIGPFLSAIPALFIALLISPGLAIAVVILYILLHELEGYVLVPKIMEKTVGTSPLAVLLAVLIGFKLAGVIGLLVSVPLVAAITVVVNELWGSKSQV